MEKALFMYNPLSGDHRLPKKLDYIFERFSEKNILLIPYRIINNNSAELQELLVNEKFSFAIISGGDGTVNYVTNLLLKNKINIPLGLIPSGTCNDFARCIGLPAKLNQCLDIILSGKTVNVDVGLINEERYFLSTCAGGSLVGVSFNTQQDLKKNFGPLAYYLKALNEVANIKPFKIKIITENETFKEEILLFIILNGHHAAGFKNLIEEADITDGIMDIVLVRSCSHIDLAGLFFKVIGNDYVTDKNIVKLRTRTAVIEGSNEVSMSIDGEKGYNLPVTIRFLHKALTVFAK
jgi:YegS/Rv2252/BmrU family lipid kinase